MDLSLDAGAAIRALVRQHRKLVARNDAIAIRDARERENVNSLWHRGGAQRDTTLHERSARNSAGANDHPF
jgi:hypothetical protein